MRRFINKWTVLIICLLIVGLWAINVQDWHQLWVISSTPDNVPIVAMLLLVPIFTWMGIRQAVANDRLIEELELCRRYYEMTFQGRPVSRLVFIGGEARQKGLCQHIARAMGVAAQVGDPLARLAKSGDIGIESGIDRRQPQPGWAVAIGLSMGPAAGGNTAGVAMTGATAEK